MTENLSFIASFVIWSFLVQKHVIATLRLHHNLKNLLEKVLNSSCLAKYYLRFPYTQ